MAEHNENTCTVGELRDLLNEFNDDYEVYAYEGESICVVILDPTGKQVGTIDCYPWQDDDPRRRA